MIEAAMTVWAKVRLRSVLETARQKEPEDLASNQDDR